MTTSTAAQPVTIEFAALLNEQGIPMLWLAGWLDSASGREGDWFYSGRGGEAVTVRPPLGTTGIRVRRWISDGLPPEYADLELDGTHVVTNSLDFERWRGFRRTGEPIPVAGDAPSHEQHQKESQSW